MASLVGTTVDRRVCVCVCGLLYTGFLLWNESRHGCGWVARPEPF